LEPLAICRDESIGNAGVFVQFKNIKLTQIQKYKNYFTFGFKPITLQWKLLFLLFPFSKTSTAEVKNREGFKLFELDFFLSFMPLLCGFSKECMAQFF
jgi:hypothetical protein